MKKLLVGAFMSISIMTNSSSVVASGDPEAGKSLTTTCVACHGADGNSLVSAFPKLAGQQEGYLLKQLEDIKSGRRAITQMAGLLDDSSSQDLADMAAYFAQQEVTTGQADPELVELGRKIYRDGNPETGVPACMACHGPSGQGIGSAAFPALAGQHADYTVSQLNSFQQESRNNDPAAMMRNIALKMNYREIDAVANYIQGLY